MAAHPPATAGGTDLHFSDTSEDLCAMVVARLHTKKRADL